METIFDFKVSFFKLLLLLQQQKALVKVVQIFTKGLNRYLPLPAFYFFHWGFYRHTHKDVAHRELKRGGAPVRKRLKISLSFLLLFQC